MNSCWGPRGGAWSQSRYRNNNHSSQPNHNLEVSRPMKPAPLPITHPGVLEDLDLYYLRQIAKSIQEYDLEQKLALELRMREGTSRLLQACKHPQQVLQAGKSLLTSNERTAAYVAELQRRKTQHRNSGHLSGCPEEPCKARVSVSDIRMPLIWKDSDHFKNRGDHRRFAVFCLLRINTEIYDTVLIGCVDRSMTDISFDDAVLFYNVTPDFEFRIEVYSHVIQDDLTAASTPRKIKHRINDSLGRAVGRKLAVSLREELQAPDLGPRFDLVASASLKVDEVSDGIKTHDLIVETTGSSHSQLPLFGHFCIRLAAQPEVLNDERISGYVDVSTHRGKECLWARLVGSQMSFWSHPESPQLDDTPIFSVPVTPKTKVSLTGFGVHVGNPGISSCTLRFDNEDDANLWLTTIKQTQLDLKCWGPAAEVMMPIHSPNPSRQTVFSHQRKTSLYDEILSRDSGCPSSTTMSEDGRLSSSSSSSTGISPAVITRSRSSSLTSSSAQRTTNKTSGSCSSSASSSLSAKISPTSLWRFRHSTDATFV